MKLSKIFFESKGHYNLIGIYITGHVFLLWPVRAFSHNILQVVGGKRPAERICTNNKTGANCKGGGGCGCIIILDLGGISVYF